MLQTAGAELARAAEHLNRRTISLADLAFALVAVTAAAIFAVYSVRLPPNVDIAWLLYAAERILGGARLYVDVVETNPPLIIFLSLPAAALARVVPISAIAIFKIGVVFLIGLSLALSARLLGSRTPGLGRDNWRVMLVVLLVVLFPLANYTFGQRDNLTFILVLPYLCAAIVRLGGRTISPVAVVMGGIMAGLGFAMKPFFLPLWLGIETYLAIKQGVRVWARAESLSILGVFLAYTAAVCILTPEYFAVAKWAAQAYGAYGRRSRLALLASSEAILSIIVVTAAWLLLKGKEFATLRGVLSIMFVAYLGSFIVQGKGWSYQSYPMVATAAIATAVAILARFGPLARPFWYRLVARFSTPVRVASLGRVVDRYRAAILGLVLLQVGSQLAMTTETVLDVLDREPIYLSRMRAAIDRIAPGGAVMALSASHHVAFPLVNVAHLRWTSRFNHLWMLPGLYADQARRTSGIQYHPLDELSELERYMIDAVVEDLRSNQPDVLIVDTTHYAGMPAEFDYLDYFGRDSRFADQLAAYSYVENVHEYHIYRRNRDATPVSHASMQSAHSNSNSR